MCVENVLSKIKIIIKTPRLHAGVVGEIVAQSRCRENAVKL